MDNTDIIAFTEFVKTTNTYFANGYADAFVMPEDGRVMIYTGKDFKSVFPSDVLGNYFYVRSDAGVTFNLQDAQRLSDCGAASYVFMDSATYYLVAFVRDADRYKLINNLRNTCAMYGDMFVIPQSALWVKESVTANELAGVPETDLQRALQRLKDYTIVRLTLSINKKYTSSECIEDVCKC